MKDIILINIAGEDKAGVTNSICAVLEKHSANVLDIGQAVIHETLSLGMLVEFPDNSQTSDALKEMLFSIDAQGLNVKFTPVQEKDYQHWVDGRRIHKHIITLLSRRISAQQIAGITGVIAKAGLNIDRIERLSGRVPLDENVAASKACIEFYVSGAIKDQAQLRQDFLELTNTMNADKAA